MVLSNPFMRKSKRKSTMITYKVAQLCQQDALSIIPIEKIAVDMEKTTEHLIKNGFLTENQKIMVTASKDKVIVSIYKNGRILVSGTTSKEAAEKIGREIYEVQEQKDACTSK